MKAFLEKLEEHYVMLVVSALSALISMRQNKGLPWLDKFLNPISGFVTACLAGFIAMEHGLPSWLASGIAWVLGQTGNVLMGIILKALRMAKRDPLKFAASVIALIWQYVLPPISKDK